MGWFATIHSEPISSESRYCLTDSRKPSLLVTVVPPANEDGIATRSTADLGHMPQFDQAGPAYAQHRLRLQRFLSLLQGTARVKNLAPHGDLHVVSIGFHDFDVGYIENMHAASGLRENAGRSRRRGLEFQLLQSG
jgi:hypothetical protein